MNLFNEQSSRDFPIASQNPDPDPLSLKTHQQFWQTADRLTRLQNVTAALSAAVTREQVADVIIENALPALHATIGVIALLSEEENEFVVLRAVGYPPKIAENWKRFSADLKMPIPDCVRQKTLIVVTSWEERQERYPDVTHIRLPGSDGALVAIPLLVQERAIGAIGLSFADARTFSDAERTFMLTIAEQCAQAMERARLYDAERQARKQAQQEAAERRKAEQERADMMAAARCLLWHADVEESDHPNFLNWQMRMIDFEAAQRFLPLELEPGESYLKANYRHRLLEDREACDRIGTDAVRAGQDYHQEYRCLAADGTLHWLAEDVHVQTIEPGQKWHVVGVCTDITERKRLESQLLQAQKLESIGRLAGGIAHDFNNILTAIMGFTDLAEEELDDPEAVRLYLQNTRHASERAAQLTQQMLAFARRQMIEPQSVNLNQLLQNLAPLLHRLIPENIQLHHVLDDDLHSVKVDPNQFEQILVNLVVNARDAMPDGGRIIIETHNSALDDEYARQHEDVKAGDYVMLVVTDTGSGMDESIRLHIFEPFFTTKAQGRGTGLGLATVYGIVKQARGHIWLYSEEGKGTTFKIYLPRTLETPEPLLTAQKPLVSARGTETLLLVEDEPAVRTIGTSALRGCGYTVLEAEHGEEALRVAAEHEGGISLLITDVVMPQMNGKQLAERLHTFRPNLKVLYCSGYTENTIVHQGVLDEGIAFLSKPFTPSALAQKVREVLDT
jgi:signal transduction histidine kinase